MMHLAIDASNIRQGGGVTHLSQLLSAAEPGTSGIARVSIWAPRATLEQLPDYAWLSKRTAQWMEGSLPQRIWGQQVLLPSEVAREPFDLLFAPGSTLPGRCPVPAVTMSQNMLPFEPERAALFGAASPMRMKMRLLRYSQGRSFKRADGIIFLTEYARRTITQALGGLHCPTALIPHGIESRFLQRPRPPRRLEDCSASEPFRFLYVSIQMPYKHQVEVAQAVASLRRQGWPVEMSFVGAPWGRYGRQVDEVCRALDPQGSFLLRPGALPFSRLHELYGRADAFVFASSCENLPNILIEAMAAGLPVISSDRGPMPEVLGDAGLYCDPASPQSMAESMLHLARDPALRAALSEAAWQRAAHCSWSRCATATFEFIAAVSRHAATAAAQRATTNASP